MTPKPLVPRAVKAAAAAPDDCLPAGRQAPGRTLVLTQTLQAAALGFHSQAIDFGAQFLEAIALAHH
jgi:hypothetical protein